MHHRVARLLPLLALPVLVNCAAIGKSLLDADTQGRRDKIGFTAGSAKADDHTLEFFERPGNGEPILLVHGFNGSRDSWNNFIPHLPADSRIIVPSLAGHGGSTFKEDASYDFARQADRLIAVVDALKLERVHVVGVSMGGAIATTFAARHPDRTESLSALCPAGINPPTPTKFQESWRAGNNELILREPAQWDHYMDLLFYEDPPSIPGPVRAHMIERALERAPRLTKIDRDFRETPGWLEEVIPKLKSPTLVVWGTGDEILHYSGSTKFKDVEGVRIELIEGCGHACVYTKPEIVAGLVNAHIAR